MKAALAIAGLALLMAACDGNPVASSDARPSPIDQRLPLIQPLGPDVLEHATSCTHGGIEDNVIWGYACSEQLVVEPYGVIWGY